MCYPGSVLDPEELVEELAELDAELAGALLLAAGPGAGLVGDPSTAGAASICVTGSPDRFYVLERAKVAVAHIVRDSALKPFTLP